MFNPNNNNNNTNTMFGSKPNETATVPSALQLQPQTSATATAAAAAPSMGSFSFGMTGGGGGGGGMAGTTPSLSFGTNQTPLSATAKPTLFGSVQQPAATPVAVSQPSGSVATATASAQPLTGAAMPAFTGFGTNNNSLLNQNTKPAQLSTTSSQPLTTTSTTAPSAAATLPNFAMPASQPQQQQQQQQQQNVAATTNNNNNNNNSTNNQQQKQQQQPISNLTTVTETTPSSAAHQQNVSQINFCQLEEHINKWTLELEEQEKLFMNQATQVNAWDKILIQNGNKISELNEAVENVKHEQLALEHELEFIAAQHSELDECITPLQKELAKIPHTNMEKAQIYLLAESLDTQMKQMSEDLKEIIEHLNEATKVQDPNDPIVQIGQILNAHMSSLQWIESSTSQITRKIDDISNMYDVLRSNNEKSFRLTYQD